MDPKVLREKLGLSQAEFSLRYRLPLATVKNWDQGRRQPTGATDLLLRVIAEHPELVAAIARKPRKP